MKAKLAVAAAIAMFAFQTNGYALVPAISRGVLTYVPSVFIPMRIAHASLACTAWAILFPLGGILIRWLPTRFLPRFHAICQIFAYFTFFAAACLGIWMSRHAHTTTMYHPVIGMLLLSLITVQLMLGTRNHFLHVNRRDVGRETLLSVPLGTFHVWFGRLLITLGMINGGLGFRYSDSAGRAPKIVYGVVAGVVWVTYVLANGPGGQRRKPSRGFKLEGSRDWHIQEGSEGNESKE